VISLAQAPDGGIFVAGNTNSRNFPITSDAVQPVFTASAGSFVSKLAPDGSSIQYSTYLTAGLSHDILSLAVDLRGRPILGVRVLDNTPSLVGRGTLTILDPSGSVTTYMTSDGSTGFLPASLALSPNGDLAVTGIPSSGPPVFALFDYR
jgi:hypothetical protein